MKRTLSLTAVLLLGLATAPALADGHDNGLGDAVSAHNSESNGLGAGKSWGEAVSSISRETNRGQGKGAGDESATAAHVESDSPGVGNMARGR